MMICYRYCSIILSFLTIFIPQISHAGTDLQGAKEALQIISDFADSFCKDIPMQGSDNNLKLAGKAQAELHGVLKKLAKIGIEGAATYDLSEYEGVLPENLVEALRDNQKCRLKIWDDLKKIVPDLTPLIEKSSIKSDYKQSDDIHDVSRVIFDLNEYSIGFENIEYRFYKVNDEPNTVLINMVNTKDFSSRYEKDVMKEADMFFKVDCDQRKICFLKKVVYNKAGKVININESKNKSWHSIYPGSFGERIENIICDTDNESQK